MQCSGSLIRVKHAIIKLGISVAVLLAYINEKTIPLFPMVFGLLYPFLLFLISNMPVFIDYGQKVDGSSASLIL